MAIGDAFRFAWNSLWRSPLVYLGLLAGWVATWVVLEALVIGGNMAPGSFGHVSLHLAYLWASAIFEAGLVRAAIDQYDERRSSFTEALLDFGLVTRFFAAKMIVVPLLLAGLAALVLPGLYIAARFGFAAFFVVDRRCGPIEALGRSRRCTRGLSGRLTLLALLLLLFNVFGAVWMGVGLLVTVPMTPLVGAFVFRRSLAHLE